MFYSVVIPCTSFLVAEYRKPQASSKDTGQLYAALHHRILALRSRVEQEQEVKNVAPEPEVTQSNEEDSDDDVLAPSGSVGSGKRERDAINNQKQTPVLTAALIAESSAVSKAGGSQKEWEEYNCFHCVQGGCSLMKHCLAV